MTRLGKGLGKALPLGIVVSGTYRFCRRKLQPPTHAGAGQGIQGLQDRVKLEWSLTRDARGGQGGGVLRGEGTFWEAAEKGPGHGGRAGAGG